MESSSFIESVVEAREDPQTLTALFCLAIPYNPTVCEHGCVGFEGILPPPAHLKCLLNQHSSANFRQVLPLYWAPSRLLRSDRSTELLPGLLRSEAITNDSSPELPLWKTRENWTVHIWGRVSERFNKLAYQHGGFLF